MTVASSALLRCPACGGALTAAPRDHEGAAGGDDRLVCAGCAQGFPVVRGIPRFVPAPTGYAESFGIQWTRYEVQRPDEDRAIFLAKTGFDPAALAGRLVLDAGCGSGRYAAVAGRLGARVFAVDVTQAVERAREVCASLPAVQVVQADILRLPFAPGTFDAIYSIGVLHHTADTRAAFDALARLLRPGGQLAIWVYRRTTGPQEAINRGLRAMTTRLPDRTLHRLATAGALVGGIPLLRHLNVVVPFSSHPDRHVRVCDTYDWYAPRYQHHHGEAEVVGWFRSHGFEEVRTLRGYAPRGGWYDRCQAWGLIPGSGVNVSGRRPPG
jgi:SAM-dependent methyltransferase